MEEFKLSDHSLYSYALHPAYLANAPVHGIHDSWNRFFADPFSILTNHYSKINEPHTYYLNDLNTYVKRNLTFLLHLFVTEFAKSHVSIFIQLNATSSNGA